MRNDRSRLRHKAFVKEYRVDGLVVQVTFISAEEKERVVQACSDAYKKHLRGEMSGTDFLDYVGMVRGKKISFYKARWERKKANSPQPKPILASDLLAGIVVDNKDVVDAAKSLVSSYKTLVAQDNKDNRAKFDKAFSVLFDLVEQMQ